MKLTNHISSLKPSVLTNVQPQVAIPHSTAPSAPALTSPKKPSSMANANWVIAFGLWAAISAVQISPYLDHPGTNMDGARAPLLDAAVLEVVLPLAAIQALFTAVTFIYVHIHNGGGGGAAGAVNRRIPEVVTFILSVSIGLLELFLFPQTGAIDDDVQATPLGAAAAHALLPSATVTFFLAMTLIYVHVRTGGGANGPVQADVELLTKMTLGATLFSLMAIVLAVYTSAR